jgi:hypothetical protein
MAIELTPDEIEAVFREYNEAVARGIPIERDLAERMQDASLGLQGHTYELRQSLDRIKTSTLGLVSALKDGQTGASIYNNGIESVTEALSIFLKPLGLIGKALGAVVGISGKLVGEVNKQTDALFKSYQDLNRFGVGVTTGIEGVMQLSQQMGYTVGELGTFSDLIGRNSQSLAMMGGTAAKGAQQLGELIQEVSPQREMWRRLGLDVEQQNAAYAGYLRILTVTGQSQRRTSADLAAGSQEYLHNLVTLSKITGQTVDELVTQREALLSEQRFASAQRDLLKKASDAERNNDLAAAARYRKQAEENEKLVGSVPKELRAGVADLTTGYVGSSQAALQVYRGMPQMAMKIMSQNFQAADVVATGEKEAAKRLDAFGKTLGGIGKFDEIFGPLIAYIKLENQSRAAAFDQRQREAEDEKTRQAALAGATASQAKLREEQLKATQNIQRAIGVLTGPVAGAMKSLATATGEATTALGNITGTNQRGAAPGAGAAAMPSSAQSAPVAAPAPSAPASSAQSAPVAAPPTTAGSSSASVAIPIDNNIRSGESQPTLSTNSSGTAAPVSAPAPGRQSSGTITTQRRIANEPFVPGRPLSKTQMSVIEFGMSMGNSYPADVMEQYNRQKSAETVAPSTTGATSTPDQSTLGAAAAQEIKYSNIATGPKSGYQATLSGLEAVIPLAGGRSIPVEIPNFNTSMMGQRDLLTAHIGRLDELISETKTNNALTQKLLKAAQA